MESTKMQEMPPVMILCGGKGTRLGDVTRVTPKPMVKVGTDPILWHIMSWYAGFGCRRFVLCLGYLKEAFQDYFRGHAAALARLGWTVELVDTGDGTATGGRVHRAAQALAPGDDTFFLTYGDGVADVDVAALLAEHRRAGRAITISAVHPLSRFGELVLDGDRVADFNEKGVASYYINGGFMAVSRAFLSRFLTDDPDMFFEQAPMHAAAAAGEMTVYRHEGFWQCMDTPREYEFLNDLWASGRAPWSHARGKDAPCA